MIPTAISRIPTLILRILITPLISFPNFPFWLFQIALSCYIFRNLNSLLRKFHSNLKSLDFCFNNLTLTS